MFQSFEDLDNGFGNNNNGGIYQWDMAQVQDESPERRATHDSFQSFASNKDLEMGKEKEEEQFYDFEEDQNNNINPLRRQDTNLSF